MKIKIWFAFILLTTFLSVIVQPPFAHAATSEPAVDGVCGGETIPYYTGEVQLAADVYDVYVKLGKPGQTAGVTGYVQLDETTCLNIGVIDASGSEWRKLGSLEWRETRQATLQLSSDILVDLPDANRPSFMLVSQVAPVCIPTTECVTAIDGQTAFIRPSSNPLGNNALRVVVASDVTDETIRRVRYYANNDFMYETKTLEAFDMRAVPFYASTMTRVVEYTSGQTAVLQSEVPIDHVDSLGSMLVRTAKKYKNTIVLAAVVTGILLLIYLVKIFVRYRRRRHNWLVGHGFIKEEADLAVTPAQQQQLRRKQLLARSYTIFQTLALVGVGVVSFVLLTTAFVGQVASINGESMVASYEDGQKVLVNKLPVTFARINNTGFVPKRGEVVVAHPSYGASMDEAEAKDEMIIKRVIGLPGETVTISYGNIRIFNTEYPDGFDSSTDAAWAANVQADDSLDMITVTLAENELFLVGDNRPASIDSRFNGPVNTTQLIGVVIQ